MAIRSKNRIFTKILLVRRAIFSLAISMMITGCRGEPSDREIRNARAFEALLSAISLMNDDELKRDADLIDELHVSGVMSDDKYIELVRIIEAAKTKDWNGALKKAYEFRAQFGDEGSFFQ